MDKLKQLNEVMHYIEANLNQKMDLKEISKIALSSEFQFKRIFSFLSGMTLSEYIRKRKLTVAAMQLQKKNVKVIDVAMRYGYSSPDAFSRAFETFHGVLPSEVKRKPHTIKSIPMMTFRLTIEGGKEMNYRIETKDAFQVVGLKTELNMENGVLTPDYGAVMEKLTDDLAEEFFELSDTEPTGVIHVTVDYEEDFDNGRLDHYIGAAVSSDYSGAFEKMNVPALTWAVFEIVGEWEVIDKEWQRIYSEWLPSSNYELMSGPTIIASKNDFTEIWIPITK